MGPFFLSWKTLRYAKHESIFASFYFTNLIFLILLASLFISPTVFLFLLLFSLLGHFIFAAASTKILNRKIIYYPWILSLTLVRVIGFYFGLFRWAVQLKTLWSDRLRGKLSPIGSKNRSPWLVQKQENKVVRSRELK